MALNQSNDRRHSESYQLTEEVNGTKGPSTQAKPLSEKQLQKLKAKHENYWCTARHYSVLHAINDLYLDYPPPESVLHHDSVFTAGSMSYLAAWRVLHGEIPGDIMLAQNIMYQHGEQKALSRANKPEKKVHPSLDSDEAVFNYALNNKVHLDVVKAKKCARHLRSMSAITDEEYKGLRAGTIKLKIGEDGWKLAHKAAAVVAAVASAIPHAEAYDYFAPTVSYNKALVGSIIVGFLTFLHKPKMSTLLAIVLLMALAKTVMVQGLPTNGIIQEKYPGLLPPNPIRGGWHNNQPAEDYWAKVENFVIELEAAMLRSDISVDEAIEILGEAKWYREKNGQTFPYPGPGEAPLSPRDVARIESDTPRTELRRKLIDQKDIKKRRSIWDKLFKKKSNSSGRS